MPLRWSYSLLNSGFQVAFQNSGSKLFPSSPQDWGCGSSNLLVWIGLNIPCKTLPQHLPLFYNYLFPCLRLLLTGIILMTISKIHLLQIFLKLYHVPYAFLGMGNSAMKKSYILAFLILLHTDSKSLMKDREER